MEISGPSGTSPYVSSGDFRNPRPCTGRVNASNRVSRYPSGSVNIVTHYLSQPADWRTSPASELRTTNSYFRNLTSFERRRSHPPSTRIRPPHRSRSGVGSQSFCIRMNANANRRSQVHPADHSQVNPGSAWRHPVFAYENPSQASGGTLSFGLR